MTSIILNSESSRLAIGDILEAASGSVVEIKDEEGAVVAEIVVHRRAETGASEEAIAWAESQLDDLLRREASDRSKDVTTAELLRLAEEAAARQVS